MSLDSVSNELREIIADNKSGSREIVDKLHQYFSKHKEEINDPLISSLHTHLSEFQSAQNYLNELLSASENNSVTEFLKQFDTSTINIYKNIYTNLNPEIEQLISFMTISNSHTILEILKLTAKEKPNIRVTVSEGRPICEGHILADKLANENIAVSIITEAQIFDAVQKVQCGIIGADKIFPSGNVVNKVGSNLIALACREFNKPFFVIADKSKFSSDNSFDKKEKPANEIYAGIKNIEIENYYFEEIPSEFITRIITD